MRKLEWSGYLKNLQSAGIKAIAWSQPS